METKARRLTADRVTYTTPEEVAALAASYYENTVQHRPDGEKRAFFLSVARSGLDVRALWAAIDYAVSVCGYGRYERDYCCLLYTSYSATAAKPLSLSKKVASSQ